MARLGHDALKRTPARLSAEIGPSDPLRFQSTEGPDFAGRGRESEGYVSEQGAPLPALPGGARSGVASQLALDALTLDAGAFLLGQLGRAGLSAGARNVGSVDAELGLYGLRLGAHPGGVELLSPRRGALLDPFRELLRGRRMSQLLSARLDEASVTGADGAQSIVVT